MVVCCSHGSLADGSMVQTGQYYAVRRNGQGQLVLGPRPSKDDSGGTEEDDEDGSNEPQHGVVDEDGSLRDMLISYRNRRSSRLKQPSPLPPPQPQPQSQAHEQPYQQSPPQEQPQQAAATETAPVAATRQTAQASTHHRAAPLPPEEEPMHQEQPLEYPTVSAPPSSVGTVGTLELEEMMRKLYAPYCKLEVPKISASSGSSSRPYHHKKSDRPTYRKIYLSQLRDHDHNHGEPSLYILHQLVAHSFWQQILLHNQQSPNHHDMIHRLPHFRLRYQDQEGDWMDLAYDDDLVDALRNPPRGCLKIRILHKLDAHHPHHHHHHRHHHRPPHNTSSTRRTHTGTQCDEQRQEQDEPEPPAPPPPPRRAAAPCRGTKSTGTTSTTTTAGNPVESSKRRTVPAPAPTTQPPPPPRRPAPSSSSRVTRTTNGTTAFTTVTGIPLDSASERYRADYDPRRSSSRRPTTDPRPLGVNNNVTNSNNSSNHPNQNNNSNSGSNWSGSLFTGTTSNNNNPPPPPPSQPQSQPPSQPPSHGPTSRRVTTARGTDIPSIMGIPVVRAGSPRNGAAVARRSSACTTTTIRSSVPLVQGYAPSITGTTVPVAGGATTVRRTVVRAQPPSQIAQRAVFHAPHHLSANHPSAGAFGTMPSGVRRSRIGGTQIELSLHRRPNALVRFDVDFLLDENGNASYWKLVEAAAQAFHIASVEHISLFHISPSSSTSMQEVSSDLDLYRQLATATARSDMSLHAKVHIFRVIDSTVLVGKQDGSHLEIPYGSFMEKNGRFSYAKLLNCARMAAEQRQPIKALAYLSPNSNGSTRNQVSIYNNASMETAFQNHNSTTKHIILHPIFQENPLNMQASTATFMLGDCAYAFDPPRVRLCTSDAIIGWDLSSLVPGRYRVSVDYYRGMSSGSVYISAGIVKQYPPSCPSAKQAAQEYRKLLPNANYLHATGSNPYDARHFFQASLGEFELVGDDQLNEHFVIVAEEKGRPLMSIRKLEFAYLGM